MFRFPPLITYLLITLLYAFTFGAFFMLSGIDSDIIQQFSLSSEQFSMLITVPLYIFAIMQVFVGTFYQKMPEKYLALMSALTIGADFCYRGSRSGLM